MQCLWKKWCIWPKGYHWPKQLHSGAIFQKKVKKRNDVGSSMHTEALFLYLKRLLGLLLWDHTDWNIDLNWNDLFSRLHRQTIFIQLLIKSSGRETWLKQKRVLLVTSPSKLLITLKVIYLYLWSCRKTDCIMLLIHNRVSVFYNKNLF